MAFGGERQWQVGVGEVGIGLVPRQVDVGVMVQIPSDACGDGRNARTLYGWFAVVGGDDENLAAGVFIAVGERGVEQGEQPFGCPLAADALQQCGDGGRIGRGGEKMRGECEQ